MILFECIRWKNFLSTGNQFTELSFTEHSTTLILGTNGTGKSTMLDALTFSLFGKPFRKINKPQLVNSVNEKDCLVEVEFSIGGTKWKVVRGIKPNTFEIWRNNSLLDQSASAIDQQKWFEQNVIKMNYKSFTQIVILGSSNFVPFMQLPAAARRECVEDFLDIKVFSTMAIMAKERLRGLLSGGWGSVNHFTTVLAVGLVGRLCLCVSLVCLCVSLCLCVSVRACSCLDWLQAQSSVVVLPCRHHCLCQTQ